MKVNYSKSSLRGSLGSPKKQKLTFENLKPHDYAKHNVQSVFKVESLNLRISTFLLF